MQINGRKGSFVYDEVTCHVIKDFQTQNPNELLSDVQAKSKLFVETSALGSVYVLGRKIHIKLIHSNLTQYFPHPFVFDCSLALSAVCTTAIVYWLLHMCLCSILSFHKIVYLM